MTGRELHQLVVEKWGKPYDLQICKRRDKIFLQVMWKYLGQVSFPLSEAEYFERLEAIATYIRGWGAVEQVRTYVAETRNRPRLGKAVSIPIDLGERSPEWIVDPV